MSWSDVAGWAFASIAAAVAVVVLYATFEVLVIDRLMAPRGKSPGPEKEDDDLGDVLDTIHCRIDDVCDRIDRLESRIVDLEADRAACRRAESGRAS